MPLADLPLIDEHSVTVAAPPEAVWDAVLRRFGGGSSTGGGRWLAWVLGADPAAPDRPASGSAVGSAVPGFRVVAADRPRLLVVTGRHRFSRYGIVFRIEPTADGARCSAESRAGFPAYQAPDLLGSGRAGQPGGDADDRDPTVEARHGIPPTTVASPPESGT